MRSQTPRSPTPFCAIHPEIEQIAVCVQTPTLERFASCLFIAA